MTAYEVYHQQNGDLTRAYYADLNKRSPRGELAVALFRAQKRSARAKDYRPGKFRRAAYDVKNWSLAEITRVLLKYKGILDITWGWGEDRSTPGFEWVLYVDLPAGQVSFHAAERGEGPDYAGEWDGCRGTSAGRVLAFCRDVEEHDGKG
jgi:hypothetical protein